MSARGYREPSIQQMKQRMSYDPSTGIFTRIVAAGGSPVGAIMGTPSGNGYLLVGFKNHHYYAHRVAFAFMTGSWPDREVDHIDGNRSNNMWSNLRLATTQQNSANSKSRRHNKLGVKGVRLHPAVGKYYARITFNRVRREIGPFLTIEEAKAAYAAEAEKCFGEFARMA